MGMLFIPRLVKADTAERKHQKSRKSCLLSWIYHSSYQSTRNINFTVISVKSDFETHQIMLKLGYITSNKRHP